MGVDMTLEDRSRQELREELDMLRGRIAQLEESGLLSGLSEEGLLHTSTAPNPLQETLHDLQKLQLEDHESSIDLLLRRDAETLRAERVSFWGVENEADLIGNKRLYTLSKAEYTSNGVHYGRDQFPRFLQALTEQWAIAANQALVDKRMEELVDCYLAPHRINSVLAVAVWLHGRLKGILIHEAVETERVWKQVECEFAQSVAQMMALSMEAAERKHAENALRQAEKDYRTFMEATPDPMVVYDTEGKVTYLNPAFTRVFGWALDELQGKQIDFVPAENLPETREMVEKLIRGEDFSQVETRRYTKDGRTINVSLSGAAFFDENDQNAGGVVYIRDVTARKKVEEELRTAHKRLEEATRHIPVIFLTAKRNEADEQKGLSLGAVDYITKPFSLAIVKARVKNHLELKRRGDMLEAMSARDPLTGLANRGRLDQVLQLEWRRSQRTARPLSLIMSDIDHFKAYNDSLGHAAGDECIKAVARALDAAMRRPADLVARYGGEEFTAILPDTESHGAGVVATAMKETVESLAVSHPHSPISDRVTVSCGVAIATPASHLTPEDLLYAGDEMLYRAKGKGRNRVETVVL